MMNRITILLLGVATLGGAAVFTTTTSHRAVAQEAAPVFVTTIPPGYRDWRVVSVAHEAGELNDIRAVLGNDIAIKAYREGKLPFPEGAIVGRIAWGYVASEENNRSFGREQSFVPAHPRMLTFNSWSRTRRNTPRLVAGATRHLIRTANLRTRRQ